MPGPGGGARGGGGSRGGGSFGGGGFNTGGHRGGFSGGPHHVGGFNRPPHHGPHLGGGWYHRPRYYGGRGGCLGGIFIPVIILFLFGFVFFSSLFDSDNVIITETENSVYDENTFQDYANEQYKKEFGNSTAYEDNILLVFLTEDENYYDYYYIAWVGDHIATDINYMLGNENTELGNAISSSVNTSSYKYSLDSNLAQVIEFLKNQIVSENIENSFSCDETHIQVDSHLTNKTSIDMTEETVNSALQSFTDTTGIPIVIVVDDIDNVFSSPVTPTVTQPSISTQVSSEIGYSNIFLIIVVIAALIALVAFLVIRNKRKMKALESDDN